MQKKTVSHFEMKKKKKKRLSSPDWSVKVKAEHEKEEQDDDGHGWNKRPRVGQGDQFNVGGTLLSFFCPDAWLFVLKR